jgi:hypothetical protein
MASQQLFEFGIYTIAHGDKLSKAASTSRATVFPEARIWRADYLLSNKQCGRRNACVVRGRNGLQPAGLLGHTDQGRN